MVRTRQLVCALLLLALPARSPGASCVAGSSAGEVNERSTARVSVSMCDYSDTVASTACPDGGVVIPKADIDSFTYSVFDHASGKELMDPNAGVLADPNANPIVFLLPVATNPIVGKCSRTTATACTTAADCPAGQTCTIAAGRWGQTHFVTGVYCWSGGCKSYQCDFTVNNLEQIP